MEAVVTHGFGDASIEEVPAPTPSADEALVEVARVQLSVTDCWKYLGMELAGLDAVADAIETGNGQLFGHEMCGVVVEVGEDVDGIAEGDRVYYTGTFPCGSCAYCTNGRPYRCADKRHIGTHRPGGLQEYVTIPTMALARLPDEVSDAEGAAMQPFHSAVGYVREAGIGIGDDVAVVGAGVMGGQCGQLALHVGANRVFAIDVDPDKLDLAERHGMEPVDARDADPVETVRRLTDGMGPDVVFEAVGGDQSRVTEGSDPIAQAYGMVRPGGTLVQVGIIFGDLTFHQHSFRSKSIDWIHPKDGALAAGPTVDLGEAAAELIASGRVTIADYVTHELPGLESFEEAVEITTNKAKYNARGPAQLVL